MKKLFCLILICFSGYCYGISPELLIFTGKDRGAGSLREQVLKVDITQKYSVKEFWLQDFADIEYIPLETTSKVLLEGTALEHLHISDSVIVTYNVKEGAIFVFSRKGKILHSFNHSGRSGEEYQNIVGITVDFAKHEIYVYDHMMKFRILVYDYDGTFKRVLRLPSNIWLGSLYDYNPEYLFCYDIKYVGNSAKESKKPYFLMSKKDGEIIPLNLFLSNRMSNVLSSKTTSVNNYNSVLQVVDVPAYPVSKNGSRIYIGDFSCDTIFCVDQGRLKAQLIKTPAGKKQTPPLLCHIFLKTERYTFLNTIKMDLSNIQSVDRVCDHYTGAVYQSVFRNRDYLSERIGRPVTMGMELPENCAAYNISVSWLLEDYKAGKLKGALQGIVSRMQEDDNPVLILVKFKD